MDIRAVTCSSISVILINLVNLPFLSLSSFQRLPVIRQAAATECGLACLAMIASFHGNNNDIAELRRRFPMSMRGANLKDMMDIAEQMNLSSRAMRYELEELPQLRTPCILHWGFNHFIVLKAVTKKGLVIHDPARGALKISMEEAQTEFTGVALELIPTKDFKKKSAGVKLKLGQLVIFDKAFLSSFSVGFVLSLLGEIFLLTTPFYLQIVIDEVLLKGDTNLLNTVALGFGLIVIFQIIASILRQLTFQFLSQTLSFDMAARVFHRLMKLPIDYFQKRELGDIQHRVQSINQIQMFISQTAPRLVLDIIFSILIIIIMIAYEPILTAIILLAVFIYVLFRIMTYGWVLRAAGDLIVAEANNQTELLETLRAMPTLKMMAIEPMRESKWHNSIAKKVNAYIRTGNLQIMNQSASMLIFQGLRVLMIYLAAKLVLEGNITVGMISAFMAYYGIFTGRIEAMIESAIQLKLLTVPLGRLSDVAFAPIETRGEDGGRSTVFQGDVSIKGAAFRYGRTDKPVFTGVNFEVKEGEFVAIIGPSGAGKTTILKIIAGLLTLNTGKLTFDERDSKTWNVRTLRQQIGMVLQEDTLLKGSIAENIALFDEEIDMERVREAARLASIADDIESFAMGYETSVGDMGSSLSGGQKQRVLLARALYKKPKLLLLDEATSHLDTENEKVVQKALENLNITRIVVAHRPQTIEKADRVYVMEGGRLITLKRAEIQKEEEIKTLK